MVSRKKSKSLRFCPSYGSLRVKVDITAGAVFGALQKGVYESCGFNGFLFPERVV